MRTTTSLLTALFLAAHLAATPAQAATRTATATAAAVQAALPDFSRLVEKAGPAVVNIRTTEKVALNDSDEAEMRELFRRFFGGPLPKDHPQVAPNDSPKDAPEPERERVQRGVGSGFIVSADGTILTNAHVVSGADEVFVRLTDGREFKARVVGADKRTDVAVLKIAGDHLPVISTFDAGSTKVGEWVIAIGSPFDLDNSVTAGIVSAKARETGDFLPLIQTDVPVNPGNSGGPLINLRGEVVGINSQIYSRSGGYMGISFAIPIADALRVAEALEASGRVTRGRLGVYLTDVERDVADSLGLARARGGLVGKLERGGPAQAALLREGDIIVAFDGKPVERSAELRRLAAATRPGTKVDLTVWRNGATRQLPLTLAELETPPPRTAKAAAPAKGADGAPAGGNGLGLSVTDLTPSLKDSLDGRGGVVIDKAEGPAQLAGLRAGDILLALNNVDVASPAAFAALAEHANGPAVALVRRGETVRYLLLRQRE